MILTMQNKQALVFSSIKYVSISEYRIIYVLEWQIAYALTRGLFWCLFPKLHSNEGNKHQNNTQVNA